MLGRAVVLLGTVTAATVGFSLTAPVGAAIPHADCRYTDVTPGDGLGSGQLEPRISGDGGTVAFRSSGPGGGIFVVDVAGGTTTQVTDTGFERLGSLDHDGTLLAYLELSEPAVRVLDLETMTEEVASADLPDGYHAQGRPALPASGAAVFFTAGNPEEEATAVFRYDLTSDELAQVTDTAPIRLAMDAAADGQRFSFQSTGDLTGDNPDGSWEMFLGTVGAPPVQVSDDTYPPSDPAVGTNRAVIDDEAETSLFATRGTVLGPERLLLQPLDEPGATNLLQGAVDTPGPGPGLGGFALSGDGSRALFAYSGDLPGAPPRRTHIYRYDRRVGRLALLTDPSLPGNVASAPDSGADGTTFVVQSPLALDVPGPSAEQQVYLGECGFFFDVGPDHLFSADVEWMADEGLSAGRADGTFGPAAGVSREALAAFSYRLAGSPATDLPSPPSFSDVPHGHAFAEEIEWASGEGIFAGYPNGTFRPGATTSRQAAAAVMHRLAGAPPVDPPEAPTFSDVPLDHAFSTEIEWAAENDVVNGFGDGSFGPGRPVTRQAAAAFLHRLADGPGLDV
jgi:hypothetical protein